MPPIEQLLLVSLTMVFGAFVAGFTALGGGAVAFPVLTKLLDWSVADARQFGVMIQSVGMTSASILLLRTHGAQLIDRRLLSYLVGCWTGALLSFFFLTLSPAATKALFSAFILTFALFNVAQVSMRLSFNDGLMATAGLVGGMLSHNLGSGADGIFFIAATFLFGQEIKRSIWQSIIIMASTSILLAGTNLALAPISPLVAWGWVFAAPVVVVFAAVGASLTRRVDDRVLHFSFLALAAAEFFWTARWLIGLVNGTG